MYTIFESRALTTPEAPFLIDPAGGQISYAAALSLVERIAGAYSVLGVKPGDRIAVQVEKSPVALLAYLASLRCGAVFLPLNTAYTAGELRYFLADAEPALFLCRPEDAALAERLCAETGVPRFASLGPERGSFTAMLEGALPSLPPYVHDPDRIAAILYTSGTTGRSKGAMLSNANLLSNARALCEYWHFTAADRLLHALPIYHTHGLFVATNVTLCAGAAMVFLERFTVDAVLDALPLSTAMMGVPTFYSRLLESPEFDRASASHMRLFVSGSAPLSPPVHAAFLERTGHAILERYGMTETNMNTSNPYEGDRIAGSVGLPLPGVEVRIADPDTGEALPDGQSGMIEVRGPNVFSGYWRNSEKTAEAFRKDGFFITGDLGYRDAHGYVFIMGRANDLIISGGFNIYPAEVENVLDAVPGVEESAVIGVPHPDLGEAAVALLKASGPEVDQKFVLDAIAEQLARFKQPRRILIMDALPRNAMGKIQKAALRQRFANLFAPGPSAACALHGCLDRGGGSDMANPGKPPARRLPQALSLISIALLGSCAAGPAEPALSGPVSVVRELALDPYPQRVFWGDLHVHTNLSFDSNSFGNERLGPDEAYRFAAGETVTASSGQPARLARPLDFLMVADHAEFLGVLSSVRGQDRAILQTTLGQRWTGLMNGETGLRGIMDDYVAMVTRQKSMDVPDQAFQHSAWDRLIDAAERHNRPGMFTALIGYEWTSMPGGRNLHRVVVFRDGAEETRATLPFSALDSDDPERLWDYLDTYEKSTSGKVLAIAHNGNLSAGLMFDDTTLSGAPLSTDYARRRMRWEPVYEVTQVKGDGEAHPLLSPDDRFADFETFYETDISLRPRSTDPEALRQSLRGDYARAGLKKGLRYADTLGANPFEFGLIGSTDTHTALSTADDDNFWGKFLDSEPSAERLGSKMGGNLWANAGLSASGYTGVWARANTRAEIFAALKRREVYATTGPRMKLRVFGGWDFAPADLTRADPDAYGYRAGVPMGGVMAAAAGKRGPTLMIRAMRDPQGAPLERVQVVKGWYAPGGEPQEHVYDVAVAGSEGASLFNLVWRDPDFDPRHQAFYYVRLMQMPTKRWTTIDAERYGLPLPEGVPRMIRERAYSSPIWYRPPSRRGGS